MAEGLTGPEGHAYSRPPEVEGEAANRAIMIADAAGVPLYIVHVSCEQAHEAIRRARQKGMRVYGEPLIQHLTLDESEYFHKDWDYAARRVMSPPFRDKAHQDEPVGRAGVGVAAGGGDRPCRLHHRAEAHGAEGVSVDPERHRRARGAAGGALDQGGRDRAADAERVRGGDLDATSRKILNVYPRKGAIVEGADADIVVWDPKLSKTVSASTQKSIIDYNVFEGLKVTAQARYTLSRGDVVWADGRNSQPQPGRGKFIARPAFSAPHRALAAWKELNCAAEDRAGSDQHPVRGLSGARRRRGGGPRRRRGRMPRPTAGRSRARRSGAAQSYREALAGFAEPVPERGLSADGGGRGAGGEGGGRAARHDQPELPRLGDRRLASRRGGGGLADLGLGADVAASPIPRPPRRRSRRWRRGGCSTCSGCRRRRASASAPGRPWRTSPRSPRRGASCCAGPAGTWRRGGSSAAPEVHVVLGGEAHSSVYLSLRLLGFGAERVHVAAADGEGRMRPDALAAVLAGLEGPTVVCLQAGNVVQRGVRSVRGADPAGAGEGRLGACGRSLRALGLRGAGAGAR